MKSDELQLILTKHVKWLASEKGGEQANLSGGDLRWADLRKANLSGANLSRADLRWANLSEANLRRADLSGANLREADLQEADLRVADLSGADLSGADLSEADLSGVMGLAVSCDYLSKLERTSEGYIVYKRIGDTSFKIKNSWIIEPGSVLEETVNPTRTQLCGCGVNFGTLEWCKKTYTESDLWKCLLRFEDLADTIVPYNTDGKARCARLTLIEKVIL